MAINDSRSMNEQLRRGVLDGSVKNMRPDAAEAEYGSATARARHLHPMNYGTFGQGSDSVSPFIDEFMPDAEVRRRQRGG